MHDQKPPATTPLPSVSCLPFIPPHYIPPCIPNICTSYIKMQDNKIYQIIIALYPSNPCCSFKNSPKHELAAAAAVPHDPNTRGKSEKGRRGSTAEAGSQDYQGRRTLPFFYYIKEEETSKARRSMIWDQLHPHGASYPPETIE